MMSLPVKHASMKQNDTSGDFCRFSVKQIWTHLKLQFILKRRFCYVCVCVCVCTYGNMEGQWFYHVQEKAGISTAHMSWTAYENDVDR